MNHICSVAGCGEPIEATVKMWLTLTENGWEIYGLGDEVTDIYCGNNHKESQMAGNHRDEIMDSLSAWLEENFPGKTWHGSAPA